MSGNAKDPWFPHMQRNPAARVRFFCFPYAGGSAVMFRSWINFFGPRVEVCPIQLPGRARRLHEIPFVKLDNLVDALESAISEYLDKPMLCFGHSMGAVIAFELVHRLLKKKTGKVMHLFVSGRQAPQVPSRTPVTYMLPEPEFINELHRLKGTPKEILENEEALELILPLIRSDFELVQTYQYQPKEPLNCGITAMGGTEDGEVSPDELDAWRQQTKAPFSRLMFPGDHFFVHSMEQEVLETVSERVKKIVGEM